MSDTKLSYSDKLELYIKYSTDPINIAALYSDETKNFRNPLEPLIGDDVTIKLRTSKDNVKNAFVVIYEDNTDKHLEMAKSESDELFDYYSYTFSSIQHKTEYCFFIKGEYQSYYYNKKGSSVHKQQGYSFIIIPDFTTPDWAKGAVMYQIYADRFYNGDPTNDVLTNEYIYLGKPTKQMQWDDPVEQDDTCNFYGGDLKGVILKLDYLKDLGVDVIYLNPIFVSPSNHKYDAQDYDYIDPHMGVVINDNYEPLNHEKFNNKFAEMYVERTTDESNLEASNAIFAELISLAHQKGMRVLIDGVFNHCGAFNKWLDREGFYSGQKDYPPGAYKKKESPYNHYFRWYDTNNWPNNDCYDGWWGYYNHPKLNYQESHELYEYMMQIAQKWVSPPFSADGWRLDVAADLGYSKEFNHKFWRDFKKAVKKANPNAVILAEHYGDAYDWLQGDQWDSIMNYDAFMEPITWFLTGMEKHSEGFRQDMLNNAEAFENAMRYHMGRMSPQAVSIAMNQLSNHDHSRFLTRTNMTVGRLHTVGAEAAGVGINMGIMHEAVVFQMTWPGNPTIYYGDEAGMVGWTDPDNRRTYPWDRENDKLISIHKLLIKIRKSSSALMSGSLEFLHTEYGVISYGRFDANDKVVVAINNNSVEKFFTIPVWRIGVKKNSSLKVLLMTNEHNFYEGDACFAVKNGSIEVYMPPFSSMLFKEV